MKPLETILLRPILTEKMLSMQEEARKYAFEVAQRANKIEIKRAVERKFEVLVENVRTINVKGKSKRMNTRKGLTHGKRSDWKKAIVTLADGYTIDLFGEKQA
ncbi:MAG: 50S ribosomal protein L23 [bacterium]